MIWCNMPEGDLFSIMHKVKWMMASQGNLELDADLFISR